MAASSWKLLAKAQSMAARSSNANSSTRRAATSATIRKHSGALTPALAKAQTACAGAGGLKFWGLPWRKRWAVSWKNSGALTPTVANAYASLMAASVKMSCCCSIAASAMRRNRSLVFSGGSPLARPKARFARSRFLNSDSRREARSAMASKSKEALSEEVSLAAPKDQARNARSPGEKSPTRDNATFATWSKSRGAGIASVAKDQTICVKSIGRTYFSPVRCLFRHSSAHFVKKALSANFCCARPEHTSASWRASSFSIRRRHSSAKNLTSNFRLPLPILSTAHAKFWLSNSSPCSRARRRAVSG
mmetsp:Transcript_20931/g.64673  ORF Transcript_20931/g.64673 Transcript_20931/m.64673 type:complete len:306 (-) Transcript_20931:413-1330(-)